MAFTVISNSLKDGDYLLNDFILSADFGFGCAASEVVGRASGDKKFCRHLLRSRRADRLGLLALAGGEHPGGCERTGRERWQRGR